MIQKTYTPNVLHRLDSMTLTSQQPSLTPLIPDSPTNEGAPSRLRLGGIRSASPTADRRWSHPPNTLMLARAARATHSPDPGAPISRRQFSSANLPVTTSEIVIHQLGNGKPSTISIPRSIRFKIISMDFPSYSPPQKTPSTPGCRASLLGQPSIPVVPGASVARIPQHLHRIPAHKYS